MPSFTCRVASLRAQLDIDVAPGVLPRVQSLFERAANGAGVEPFRLAMDRSAFTAHRPPVDWVINNDVLGSTLDSLLSASAPTELGSRDVAVLYADELDGHPGLLGVMFDTGYSGLASQDATARQGCAVFLDAIRRARPDPLEFRREVVFTTAHELGHLFNLWHVDDPVSVMARSPEGEEALPIPSPAFRPEHEAFLRQCARSRFVHPGGSRYGERGVLGPVDGVSENRPTRKTDVHLAVHIEEGEFWRFEPVELDVVVSTSSRTPLALPDTLDPGYDEFVVWIEEPSGDRRRYRSPRRFCRNLGHIEVRRGRPFRRDIALFAGADGYTFRVPGEHSIWVEWRPAGRRMLRSRSVTVLVKAARPGSRGYRELERDLTDSAVARLLCLRTGPLSSGAARRLHRAARRRQCSLPAALEYVLGRASLPMAGAKPGALAAARARAHLATAVRGLSPRSNRHRRAQALLAELS